MRYEQMIKEDLCWGRERDLYVSNRDAAPRPKPPCRQSEISDGPSTRPSLAQINLWLVESPN